MEWGGGGGGWFRGPHFGQILQPHIQLFLCKFLTLYILGKWTPSFQNWTHLAPELFVAINQSPLSQLQPCYYCLYSARHGTLDYYDHTTIIHNQEFRTKTWPPLPITGLHYG